MLGGDVIAVGAQPAEVGRARGARARPTSRRGSAGSGSPRRASAGASPRSAASCPRCSPRRPTRAAAAAGRPSATPVRQYSRAAASAISRRLLAVVALVRDEVLQDHLLDVAVLGVHRGERLQRFASRSSSVSPIPTRIPLVNGIFSSPGRRGSSPGAAPGAWSASPRARSASAARRPTRASAPARPSPRAAAPDPRARARRGSCAASRPRSSARSHVQTTYAVKSSCPYSRSRVAHLGVDLGVLAGQHQQLLDLPPAPRRRGSRAPPRARTGAPCGWRTRSTCSSTGTSATATASGCARR